MKKMMIAALLAAGLLGASGSAAAGEPEYLVTINDQEISFPQQPIMSNGSILVPLRAVFQSLGADVSYDSSTQTITGTKGDTTVTLRIGSTTAQKNESVMTLAQPPLLVNGSVFVPIRFISESLGADVRWDASANTVRIYAKVSAAMLRAKDELPVTNDNNEPIVLQHGGNVKLKWWYQDQSPYQHFDGYLGSERNLNAVGFGETLTFDLETGEMINETALENERSLFNARATLDQDGFYSVRIDQGDHAWIWEGVPLDTSSNVSPILVSENGEPLMNVLRITAALDRNQSLIVPTTEGLAAFNLDGERIWLHKEWETEDGTLSALGMILEMVTDAQNHVYITYTNGFVALDEQGDLVAALPGFYPVVLEDGTLVESGISYRIQDGELVKGSELFLGDRSRYDFSLGDTTFRYVDPNSSQVLWSYGLSAYEKGLGYELFEGLVVDGDDNVYASTTGGTLHSLDRNGNLRFILTVNNRTISKALVLPLASDEFLVLVDNKVMAFEMIQ